MTGTIRTYDAEVRAGVHRDIRQIAESIAASANARADVEIIELYDPLVNNERVTARAVPVLERAADGDATVNERSGAAEDMSFFLNDVPGLYFFLGIVPRNQDLAKAAPNHSPNFFIDEQALVVGVRALAMLAVNHWPPRRPTDGRASPRANASGVLARHHGRRHPAGMDQPSDPVRAPVQRLSVPAAVPGPGRAAGEGRPHPRRPRALCAVHLARGPAAPRPRHPVGGVRHPSGGVSGPHQPGLPHHRDQSLGDQPRA